MLVSEQLDLLGQAAVGTEPCELQAYCFMPDHLHLLVSVHSDATDVLGFVKSYKQRSGFAFKQRTRTQLWQHRVYDHILQPNEPWEAVAWYIWMNPVRGGLCQHPGEWPFSGSLTVDWQRLMRLPHELWTPPWKAKNAGLGNQGLPPVGATA